MHANHFARSTVFTAMATLAAALPRGSLRAQGPPAPGGELAASFAFAVVADPHCAEKAR